MPPIFSACDCVLVVSEVASRVSVLVAIEAVESDFGLCRLKCAEAMKSVTNSQEFP